MNAAKRFINIICIILALAAACMGIAGFFLIRSESLKRNIGAISSLAAYDSEKTADSSSVKPEKKEIINNSQKKVFYLEVKNGKKIITGSGFLYNRYGDVATNAHVLGGQSVVTVRLDDSTTEYTGYVIGAGTDRDIALIRVPELSGLEPLEIETEKTVEVGDEVIAFGSPLGYQNTATTGIISGLGRSFDIEPFHYENVYQISAPISPGSSGGPLISADTGRVLGINSAGENSGAIGFSIPINQCIKDFESWVNNPSVTAQTNGNGIFHERLTGESLEKRASELVEYLYRCINEKDYQTAYLLWGGDWQKETSYQGYRLGFTSTSSVRTGDFKTSARKDGNVDVNLKLSAQEGFADGFSARVSYELHYVVGYENDVLKILDGRAKKINN